MRRRSTRVARFRTRNGASGIDYLRLIEQEHERGWLARRINYHELAASAADDRDGRDADDNDDDDEGVGGVPALVRS